MVLVLRGVGLSNHGPHGLQAAKQSLQKAPAAPRLEPGVVRLAAADAAGLRAKPRLRAPTTTPTAAPAAATLAGVVLVQLQHAVVKVPPRGSVAGRGAAATGVGGQSAVTAAVAPHLSARVDGEHIAQDTLRGGQVRLRGAGGGVGIDASVRGLRDGGAEA